MLCSRRGVGGFSLAAEGGSTPTLSDGGTQTPGHQCCAPWHEPSNNSKVYAWPTGNTQHALRTLTCSAEARPGRTWLAVRQDILHFCARVLANRDVYGLSCGVPLRDRGSSPFPLAGRHGGASFVGSHDDLEPTAIRPSDRPSAGKGTSGWHVGHHVLRFTSIRIWRARLRDSSSSGGIRLPVPLYISSGVWPRNAE